MNGIEWLSESGEKLFFELQQQRLAQQAEEVFDIVIVGSGYGGAVAAARLAGATHLATARKLSVLVLERGREIVPGGFPDRFAELPGEVRVNWHDDPEPKGRRDGLLDLRLGTDVSALVGNGLGGGSLINAGVLAHPDLTTFKTAPWPSALRDADMSSYFDRVKRMLGSARTPEPKPAKLSALDALARELEPDAVVDRRADIAVNFTASTNAAGVFQQACIRCGDCFTGCNHWAKNTLAMNYLPLARRRGGRIVTGVTVLSLGHRQGGEGWTLDISLTDAEVAERFAETQQPASSKSTRKPKVRSALTTLHARRVILAAGTFGSTEILLRSQAKHRLSFSTQLGKRFSTNGDMIAIGYKMRPRVNASASETLAPDQRDIGPTITGMIDMRDSANPAHRGVVIEEMAIPAALRRLFEETITTFGALHGLAHLDWSRHSSKAVGQDPAAIDQNAVEHTAVYATMGNDRAEGTLALIPPKPAARGAASVESLASAVQPHGDGGIVVQWENVAECEVFRQSMAVLNEGHAHAAVGGKVVPYPLWKPLPEQLETVLGNPAGKGSVLTVHPLGGCAMGDSAETAVVNAFGQVYRGKTGKDAHDGLVVLDGSVVPSALGINPCLTIAGLAEHAVEHLVLRWNLAAPNDADIAALPPLPAPPVLNSTARKIRSTRPTALRAAEQLEGDLRFPAESGGGQAKPLRAVLSIEFEPIANLETFLAQHPKIISIANAKLELAETKAGNSDSNADAQATWSSSTAVSGSLSMLEREDSSALQRIVRVIWAWLWNRGLRDIWAGLRHREQKSGGGYLAKLKGLIALASHAGEARRFVYRLLVQADVRDANGIILRRGDWLIGEKRIAYTYRANPWHQLMQLQMSLQRAGGGRAIPLGMIEVDPMHFVKANAVQLQLVEQQNQPTAIADLMSFGAYVARLLGNIHIWSFRAPDRPERETAYEYVSPGNGAPAICAARLPGAVPGIGAPETVTVPSENKFHIRHPDGSSEEIALKRSAEIRLSRYRPRERARAGLKPVVLLHGFGASGTTFTHPGIGTNLVQHLVGLGFDCWVVDLRTSIGLASSLEQWTFEDAAYGDIPAAIDKVLAVTAAGQVNVVAHCIGSAMFCMAALGGRLNPDSIHAAVLSQVGPLIKLPSLNRARGYIAGYLKYLLQWSKLDITAPRSPAIDMVDRLLSSYPNPKYEWSAHHPLAPWATVPHEVFCNRANAIFGRLFEHANLGAGVLDSFGDLLGHVNLKTFQQTMFYATKGRLTDHLGCSAYVNYKSIASFFRFPVCMLHGKESEVFHYTGSRESVDMLRWIFEPPATLAEGHSAARADNRLRFHAIEHYGHQDVVIGKNAHVDVFPRISGFLLEHENAQPMTANDAVSAVFRKPRLGPVLGWTRRADAAAGDAPMVANLMFVPDDLRSAPLYALSMVLHENGEPVPEHATVHALQTVAPKLLPYATQAQTDGGRPLVVAQTIEVELPAQPDDYLIVVLTLHQEPAFAPDDDAADLPLAALDRAQWDAKASTLAAGPLSAVQFERYVAPVLAGYRGAELKSELAAMGARVVDADYERNTSVASLSKRVLTASGSAKASLGLAIDEADDSLVFATGSCRYAATVFDRELADRSFGRLRDLLLNCPEGRGCPQLLLMIGDQIYADATAGLFDPTSGLDRFDQRYLEVWSAPNAREVLRRLPTYMMLDDHEVQDNWEEEALLQRSALYAFDAYQRKLAPPNPLRAQVVRDAKEVPYWYAFSSGGYGFFMADTRTERERAKAADRTLDEIMGERQMGALQQWLQEQHRANPGRPKFVVSPGVLAPWLKVTHGGAEYALRADGWDSFPGSLNTLLTFIAEENITNVIFLSGDYHASAVCDMKLSIAGRPAVQVYSIVSSGFYAPYPFANAFPDVLALHHRGTHADWLGMNGSSSERFDRLHIDYTTRSLITCEAFAVISVRPRPEERGRKRWDVTIEFDAADGVTSSAITLTD